MVSRKCVILILIIILTTVLGNNDHVYKSYQSTVYCSASSPILYPTSTEELQQLIKNAWEKGSTVKILGSRHSTTDIICTEGVPISLSQMVKEPEPEGSGKDGEAWTFSAGMEVEAALAFLKENRRTLEGIPLFSGITLGGLLATGAHGSSLNHPASITESLLGVSFVDGEGKLVKVDSSEEILNGFKVHLGLLGALVSVTLRTVPLYKMRIEHVVLKDDVLFDETVVEMATYFDHFQVWWFPSQEEIVVGRGIHVDLPEKGEAHANYVMSVGENLAKGTRFAYDWFHRLRFKLGLDFLESSTLNWLKGIEGDPTPPIFEESGRLKNPAVGYAWQLLSTTCSESCWWNNPYALVNGFESAVAIPLTRLTSALKTIKEIVKEIPVSFHMFGVLIRFLQPTSGYMSLASGQTATATIEWISPLSHDIYTTTVTGFGAYQAILQGLMERDGRPHWGKNGLIFHSRSALQSERFPGREKFLAVMRRFDPHGVFTNKFSRRLQNLSEEMDVDPQTEMCALLDFCICGKDGDCAAGQTCGNLEKYRVCLDEGITWPRIYFIAFSFTIATFLMLVISVCKFSLFQWHRPLSLR